MDFDFDKALSLGEWLNQQRWSTIDEASKSLLRAAMQQMQMSARAFHRILKLARTIADLAGSDKIETPHLAEAIQYRPRKQTERNLVFHQRLDPLSEDAFPDIL